VHLVQLHSFHFHPLHHLLVMLLGPLRRHPLKAMHGLDIHRANLGGAHVTDTPTLALEQPRHGFFGQLAVTHQRPAALRKFLATAHTAQPLDMTQKTTPRAMADIPPTRNIEVRAGLIGTAKAAILGLYNWCWRHIPSPFPARKSSQDIDSTPVFLCHPPPGLPLPASLVIIIKYQARCQFPPRGSGIAGRSCSY
jgi:hypothetical protein